MKTLLLGDTHGRPYWKDIIKKETPDRVIFIGDYFDSFNIPAVSQIQNFKDIIEFKENTHIEVVMLIGNHDHHYLSDETYSGFQSAAKWDIQDLLTKNMNHLQVGYSFDDILCTHAGVSPVWMDEVFGWNGWSSNNLVQLINDLYKYKPRSFNFSHGGYDPYGNHPSQGPMWIRPAALMKSNKGDNGLKKRFIQVVGHTQVTNIFDSVTAHEKSMGSRYLLIDALEGGGYVYHLDGKFYPNTIPLVEKNR
jgi:hypothetical protein